MTIDSIFLQRVIVDELDWAITESVKLYYECIKNDPYNRDTYKEYITEVNLLRREYETIPNELLLNKKLDDPLTPSEIVSNVEARIHYIAFKLQEVLNRYRQGRHMKRRFVFTISDKIITKLKVLVSSLYF